MNNYTDIREVSTFKLKVEVLARKENGPLNEAFNPFTTHEIQVELANRANKRLLEAEKETQDIGLDQYSNDQIEAEFIKRYHADEPHLLLSIGNGRTIFDAKGKSITLLERLEQAFTHDPKCCDLFANAIVSAKINKFSKMINQ